MLSKSSSVADRFDAVRPLITNTGSVNNIHQDTPEYYS